MHRHPVKPMPIVFEGYQCGGKEYHSCQYGLGQCNLCWDYQNNGRKPNYPVPALYQGFVQYPGELTLYSNGKALQCWGTRFKDYAALNFNAWHKVFRLG